MENYAFVLAAIAILLSPGPTNALIALRGARQGLHSVIQMMPAELLGYLSAILPLVYLNGKLLEPWPRAAVGLKVLAALWVMYLAISLWARRDGAGSFGEVTARRVYVTTLLNPKAQIIGLVLLPTADEPHFKERLGLFCLMVMAAALVWGTAGTVIQMSGGSRRLSIVQRFASVWLAVVSAMLLAQVISS
ncbi:hypothetical protein CK218_12870 [Mesorhizobium sp. WSM3879]|uniref:LysE family translocator n=1 Tax=Mesorhizobium sp. WSM3879 TaxID=2029406 RepID=UPI000BAE7F90|nr:hypothetical protein [Mesorhizobium sp. WSM3879]PBB81251.1 hypothetical protein CK218_12870 [Mesorhizobium sp. WSM3879]